MGKSLKSNFYILVVDDEERSVKYFKKYFCEDYKILTASSAKDALEILSRKSSEVGVLVSDQKMPKLSGVELLSEVKVKYPNIVRILTTAYADLDDNIAAINQSNVFGYLKKPWELDTVKSVLDKAFDKFNDNLSVKTLGGSIAHEIRNPLNTISLSLSHIKSFVENSDETRKDSALDKQIIEMVEFASNSIKRANDLIDKTLAGLNNKEIDKNSFQHLDVFSIIQKVISEYGYKNKHEAQIIRNILPKKIKSFTFKGDETLFMYIFFNLIKNSLYYQNYCANFKIDVKIQSKKNSNIVRFRDNGPGIESEKLELIFENFITSNKKGGTGLGLPFCRKVMKSFGGSIRCESVKEKYCEFILEFPKVLESEILEENKKSSLLEDDKKIDSNISVVILANKVFAKKNEKFLRQYFRSPNIVLLSTIEEVKNYLQQGQCDTILVEAKLLKTISKTAINKIKENDPDLSIILINNKKSQDYLDYDFDLIEEYSLTKRNYEASLIRSICKANLINYIPEIKNKTKFQNKRILLADDDESSLMILDKFLRNNRFNVQKVRDGNELYEEFSKNKYDLLITDFNMPHLRGDEATQKIRNLEEIKSKKKGHVPIICYCGDSSKEIIRKILKSGMDDYFLKGNNTRHLLDLVKFWI